MAMAPERDRGGLRLDPRVLGGDDGRASDGGLGPARGRARVGGRSGRGGEKGGGRRGGGLGGGGWGRGRGGGGGGVGGWGRGLQAVGGGGAAMAGVGEPELAAEGRRVAYRYAAGLVEWYE